MDELKEALIELIELGMSVKMDSPIVNVEDYGNDDEITVFAADGKAYNLSIIKDLGGC